MLGRTQNLETYVRLVHTRMDYKEAQRPVNLSFVHDNGGFLRYAVGIRHMPYAARLLCTRGTD